MNDFCLQLQWLYNITNKIYQLNHRTAASNTLMSNDAGFVAVTYFSHGRHLLIYLP